MLLETINQDLKDAMKKKDKERLEVIRLIKTALMNERIKLGKDALSEEDELTVISREVKQRKDSISEFEKANRNDLVEKEKQQLDILQTYLPKQLTEDEIKALIKTICEEQNATSMKDLGKVMGIVSKEAKGKADMGLVSKLVKEILNN